MLGQGAIASPPNLGLAPQTFWLQSKYVLLKPNSSDVTKLFKLAFEFQLPQFVECECELSLDKG